MNRGDLSNEQWERLKPLLPTQKPHTGKPNNDHRQKAGIRNQIFTQLQALAEQHGELDWKTHYVDGTVTRELH